MNRRELFGEEYCQERAQKCREHAAKQLESAKLWESMGRDHEARIANEMYFHFLDKAKEWEEK